MPFTKNSNLIQLFNYESAIEKQTQIILDQFKQYKQEITQTQQKENNQWPHSNKNKQKNDEEKYICFQLIEIIHYHFPRSSTFDIYLVSPGGLEFDEKHQFIYKENQNTYPVNREQEICSFNETLTFSVNQNQLKHRHPQNLDQIYVLVIFKFSMQLSKNEIYNDPVGWIAVPIFNKSGISNKGLFQQNVRKLPIINKIPFDNDNYQNIQLAQFKFKIFVEEEEYDDENEEDIVSKQQSETNSRNSQITL